MSRGFADEATRAGPLMLRKAMLATLRAEGMISDSALKRVAALAAKESIRLPHVPLEASQQLQSLALTTPECARWLFLSYADCNVPVGSEVIELKAPGAGPGISVTGILLAVTQQFSSPLDAVPCGWKTMCLFQFPSGVPKTVDELPRLDEWSFEPKLDLIVALKENIDVSITSS